MLKVSGLHLHYGASHALRGIDLVAERGKITCVLGRNGVGKTSLMRAVVGQQPLTRGSVKWDGKDISNMAVFERARQGIAAGVGRGQRAGPIIAPPREVPIVKQICMI